MTQPYRPLSPAIFTAVLLLSAGSAAASCPAGQVDAAMDRLEVQVLGPLSADQRVKTEAILVELCASQPALADRNPGESRIDAPQAADSQTAQVEAEDPDSTNILGMTIRKGGPDSKGRKRLKTKR